MEKCHVSTGEPRKDSLLHLQPASVVSGSQFKKKEIIHYDRAYQFYIIFFRSARDQSFNKYVVVMIFSSGSNTVFPFFKYLGFPAAPPALRPHHHRPPPGSQGPTGEAGLRWRVPVCGSVEGLGVCDGHGVEDLVQQLQGSVQVDLDPTRRLLDALPGVVGPPALHEAHPQDAQAPQVVDADARGGGQTCEVGVGGWKGQGGVPVFPTCSAVRGTH